MRVYFLAVVWLYVVELISFSYGEHSIYTDGNIFARHVKRAISNGNDVVYNTDNMRNDYAASFAVKNIHNWDEVINAVKALPLESHKNDEAIAVKISATVGDMLLSIWDSIVKINSRQKAQSKFNRKSIDMVLNKMPKKIVLIALVDQNWGFLSSTIPNRTAATINMTNHLRIHKSTYDTLRYFLDSDKIVAVFVNAHVDNAIRVHPKVLSTPIGIRNRRAFPGVQKLPNLTKTSLLVINNSGWKWRTGINHMVMKAFNYTIQNQYNVRTPMSVWHRAIRTAKFILCPSGFSMDSYRIWETLLLGSIPVVESNPPGLDRIYSNLPVLVVEDFSVVTPAFLDAAYPCFCEHAHLYNYELLRASYWLNLTAWTARTGSLEKIAENHPYRNKYCDFLPNINTTKTR